MIQLMLIWGVCAHFGRVMQQADAVPALLHSNTMHRWGLLVVPTCCCKAAQPIWIYKVINHCCPINTGEGPITVCPSKVLCYLTPQSDLKAAVICLIVDTSTHDLHRSIQGVVSMFGQWQRASTAVLSFNSVLSGTAELEFQPISGCLHPEAQKCAVAEDTILISQLSGQDMLMGRKQQALLSTHNGGPITRADIVGLLEPQSTI